MLEAAGGSITVGTGHSEGPALNCFLPISVPSGMTNTGTSQRGTLAGMGANYSAPTSNGDLGGDQQELVSQHRIGNQQIIRAYRPPGLLHLRLFEKTPFAFCFASSVTSQSSNLSHS